MILLNFGYTQDWLAIGTTVVFVFVFSFAKWATLGVVLIFYFAELATIGVVLDFWF